MEPTCVKVYSRSLLGSGFSFDKGYKPIPLTEASVAPLSKDASLKDIG